MAVLPFLNPTGNPEQEYLADGLTDEMISQLGRLHPQGLSVIARPSVMRYKDGDTPIAQIARELNVDVVLMGSAHREADRVRVKAELIALDGQVTLWADTFERELSGILAIKGEVAELVARSLALELLPAEQDRLTSIRTVDPEVYDDVLRGTYFRQKLTPADLDIAQRYFELALAKDASYAPAYEGLAWVWSCRQQMQIVAPGEAGPKAKAAATLAIALDDTSAGAHEALAMVRTWTDWDWAGADPEWQRTLELNPSDAKAHAYYAHFLAVTGRARQALPHSERAVALDPFNALFHGLHAIVLYFDRRYDDATAAARTALFMDPALGLASSALQVVLITEGRRDEQLDVQRQRIAHDPELLAAFEEGLAQGGYEGAQRRLADLLGAKYEREAGIPDAGFARISMPVEISLRCLEGGDREGAIRWLETAYEVRDPNLPYLGMPIYDSLRSEPRFQALLRKMNLPQAGSSRPPGPGRA